MDESKQIAIARFLKKNARVTDSRVSELWEKFFAVDIPAYIKGQQSIDTTFQPYEVYDFIREQLNVDLLKAVFDRIPPNVITQNFKDIKNGELELKYKDITGLCERAFVNIYNIGLLDLSNTKIRSIPKNAFVGVGDIQNRGSLVILLPNTVRDIRCIPGSEKGIYICDNKRNIKVNLPNGTFTNVPDGMTEEDVFMQTMIFTTQEYQELANQSQQTQECLSEETVLSDQSRRDLEKTLKDPKTTTTSALKAVQGAVATDSKLVQDAIRKEMQGGIARL